MAPFGSRVRVAAVAERQWGRITRAQLVALGVPTSTMTHWLSQGYLHRLLPRVYAVGHPGRSTEADLAAALLYAGPGAVLSHATAAWWWGLADRPPREIQVRTPRQCRSLPGIRVHRRSTAPRVTHNGLPVTPVPQTLVDYAAHASRAKLRRALANADYRGILRTTEAEAVCTRGRPGATRLRAALREHCPELARTRSDLEIAFFELCQRAELPLPHINRRVHGWTVDFYWPERALVVEVDGFGNHRSPAQVRRDRRMDLALRGRGLTVRRYSDQQITREAGAVLAELRAASRADGPLSRP